MINKEKVRYLVREQLEAVAGDSDAIDDIIARQSITKRDLLRAKRAAGDLVNAGRRLLNLLDGATR